MTRTEVLDKVGSLSLLADDIHATTDLVASYFEVDAETIKKLVQRNRTACGSSRATNSGPW
jgi:Co/Zn/Cd efflux system component